MSRTINDIATWCSSTMLKRADMDAAIIDCAVKSYISVCSIVPFDELATASSELAVSTANNELDISSLDMCGIISVRISYSSTDKRRMRKSSVKIFDQYNVTSGRPFLYARFNKKLEFNKIPDSSAYTIQIRYWAQPTIDATPANTVIVTPIQWDELYRWLTLYRVYHALDQIEKAMALVQPKPLPSQASPRKAYMTEVGIIPHLWNELCKTTSFLEAPDEDFGINPMIRSYTAVL